MKEISSGIYKIVSPTGRIYIGQAVNLTRRISEYKYLKCKSQQLLYRSIIKYGFVNHSFEVIERCDVRFLHEREIYFIDRYKSNQSRFKSNRGLNLTDGGEGSRGFKHTPESKMKMSISTSKQKHTAESNLSRSQKLLGRPCPENCLRALIGKKQSDDHKRKRLAGLFRKVIDVSTGEVYSSVREASEAVGISNSGLIQKLNGSRENNTSLKLYHGN